jgi:YD repeat-containing protein
MVSYWSNTTAASVNSMAATQGPTKSGWTYFEHILPVGTTSVTVSGTVKIDELRLYPADAQMTTYTFIPLIGMDSQCDVNNHVTYYEYDPLGRLLDIKDMDGNILKTFRYNYKQ